MTKPWERLPDESTKAYAAFVEYLKLSREDRNVPRAYRICSGHAEAKNVPGYFRSWSTCFEWLERAYAYDDAQLEKDLKALELQRKEARIRQAKAGRAIIEAGKALLGETEGVSAAGAAEMILKGQKVENIALGVATEITETNIKGEVNTHGDIDRLLADPRTRGAALAMLEAIELSKCDANGPGVIREPGEMAPSEAPPADQPEAN